METEGYFNLKSSYMSFRFIWMPILWVYDHYTYLIISVRGSILDIKIWRKLLWSGLRPPKFYVQIMRKLSWSSLACIYKKLHKGQLIHKLISLFVHPAINLFVYLFIHSFIHSFKAEPHTIVLLCETLFFCLLKSNQHQIKFICTTINIVSAKSHTFICTKTYYIIILQIHGYIK